MTEAKQPTKEQIRKFWESCGLRWGIGGGWFYGEVYCEVYCGDEIPIDLPNLFKYALTIPKADLHINFHEIHHWVNGKVFTECVIVEDNNEIGKAIVEGLLKDKAALALFWAIMEAKQ